MDVHVRLDFRLRTDQSTPNAAIDWAATWAQHLLAVQSPVSEPRIAVTVIPPATP